MNTKFLLSAALAVLCFCLIPVTQVRADSTDSFSYQFGGNTYTWELPSSPAVTPENAYPGVAFTLPDVTVLENGENLIVGTMDFFSAACAGGLDFYVGDYYFLFNTTGPQLYSGPESSPTFLGGTFGPMTEYQNSFDGVAGGTLVVTAPVPEPSSLLLLAVGIGLALAASLFHLSALMRSFL